MPRPSSPEQAFAAWLAQRDAPFDSLIAAYPEHADRLRFLHARWIELEPVLRLVGMNPGVPASFAERLKATHGEGVDPEVSLAAPGGEESKGTSELLQRLGRQRSGSRYRLEGEVARGGMGAILRVWDEDIRRHLAMKVILGRADTPTSGTTPNVDSKQLARFLEEAQVTGQLDHPGIVPVHELGIDSDGRVYFTMKLVKGRDLKAIFDLVFEDKEGWNETRALSVILKVCEAMAYAHAKGVIHRDLKPANVMVGNFGEVFVMDWGLARVLGTKDRHDIRIAPEFATSLHSVKTERREAREDLSDSPIITMDGDVMGTPTYMPIEQARGQIEKLTARSDVYAVGAMIYHLLARRAPYVTPGARVSNRTILARVLDGPPTPLASLRKDVPLELVAICDKSMAREASHRYADTVALAEDLRAYLEHRVVVAYETGTWAETKKWVQRNKPLASSLAAAVLLLIAGLTASLAFKARADQREAETFAAKNTLQQRNEELATITIEARRSAHNARESESAAQTARAAADERAREARSSLYVAAVTGAQSARRFNEPASVRRLLDSAPEELRNWEWHYLDAVSDTSVLTLQGQATPLFSPDGSRIVTTSMDNTARVWDATSGKELARLAGHTAVVNSVSFSPDGSRIVTASSDSTARVWNATSGQELGRLEADTGRMYFASFSPDGSRIVTTSSNTARVWDATSGKQLERLDGDISICPLACFSPDGSRIVTSVNNTPRVWDATNGKELARLESDDEFRIWSASFSPDGSRILTASSSTARVWDAMSGTELERLNGLGLLLSASFSPDGSRIVTASVDSDVFVWDATNGKEFARLEGHTDSAPFASFSPDGARIVTASEDNTARVWDATSGKELALLQGHTAAVNSASFSPDGSRIVTASDDNTVRVWDATSRQELGRLGEAQFTVWSGSFSPDGSRIVTASPDAARVWDATSGKELARLRAHEGGVSVACFSPDGSRIVTASSNTARVWDATSGKELTRLEGHTGPVQSACFSPDGSRIVTTSEDNTAYVWDAVSSKELARLEGHRGGVSVACFSPDGSRIVTASFNTALVWDAKSGKELTRLEGHTGPVQSACFSPDGSRIVTTSEDTTAYVWDVVSSKELAQLRGHRGGVSFASFSRDGARIVTASPETAHVWDATSGKELTRLDGHTGTVESASFNPDGSRIFTASWDNTVRVWDATSGKELARLDGHTDSVYFAALSPDGSRIVTASLDNTVRIWDSAPYRVRYAERQAVLDARPSALALVEALLVRSTGFVDAGSRLRTHDSLPPLVRQAALNALTERARIAQQKANELQVAQDKREELAHLVGSGQSDVTERLRMIEREITALEQDSDVRRWLDEDRR